MAGSKSTVIGGLACVKQLKFPKRDPKRELHECCSFNSKAKMITVDEHQCFCKISKNLETV